MRSGQDNCRFHLHSQLGHRWSLVIHPSLLLRPGAGVSFYYPLLWPCFCFPRPSLVSWQRVQQKSFGKDNLWISCYITHTKPKEAQSSIPLPRLSLSLGGLLYFLLMDSFKWQTCTHWHDFSFNMIQGSCGNFDLRGYVILRYRQTHVNLKLHGQHQCWQHL